MKPGVIALSLQPDYLFGVKKVNSITGGNGQLECRLIFLLKIRDEIAHQLLLHLPLLRISFDDLLVNGILQFRNIQRLQQVIQRTEADCFDNIPVISRGENDIKVSGAGPVLQVKPFHVGHFNIRHQQVEFPLGNHGQRILRSAAVLFI
jgi:hypothetical protein